jgi:glutamate-ammonia-ligase adenylyltransferase
MTWELELLARCGPELAPAVDAIRAEAARQNDPAAALAAVSQFLAGDPSAPASLRAIAGEPRLAGLLMTLAAGSRYAFDQACLRPGLFWQVVEEGQHAQVWGRRLIATTLARELSEGHLSEDAFAAALLRCKHHHMLRIILGDLAGVMRLPSVVSELSDLTDAIIQAAVVRARATVGARGVQPPPFTVLAMGKLGARELNYSSDIDLVFAYAAPADGDRDEAHQLARRLGGEVIRLLEGSGGPLLYRVDMRLRPEGERGELALSVAETRDYYWSAGRPWERQALIKARPVGGDLELGDRLLGELRSWVFPADPRWEDLEESRTMRRRIEERAQEANVKTGAGGIRDIEFLAQHFQLLHGGRTPELRDRATLPTLRSLADRAILPRPDAVWLEDAYIWLRMVEHRLQMWEDRQEHEIPADPQARTRLAWRCGFAGDTALAGFDAKLAGVRARVRDLASRHFLQRTPADDAAIALLVQGQADERLAGRVLAAAGFTDLPAAARQVRQLADEPFFILARARTEHALQQLMPALLHLIGGSPNPDQTLANLVRVVSAVGGRAVFFELLAARPDVLRLFVDLAGWSNYLIDLLERTPGLPDEILDALGRRPARAAALHGEARQLVHGIEDLAQPLAFLRARELAVAAIHDLRGERQQPVGERLAVLAEVLSAAVLQRQLAQRAKAWGIPEQAGRPTRFAILALGKLGGREMNYASDLDVIFVCDGGGTCPRNGRDGDEFWTRIAQDWSRIMQEGGLAEVDARLRPWGEQGPLVTTLEALAAYWAEPREAWERMAMVRAAPLAGDGRLADEAIALLRASAVAAPVPADLLAQVRGMRRRLEDSVAGEDHLKRGPGGYVDAEFVAQACSLGLAVEAGAATGTAATLARLGAAGRIPTAAAAEMAEDLALLRFVESRLRLAEGRSTSAVPLEPVAREGLARRCGWDDRPDLETRLAAARARLRHWFDGITASG